MRLSVLAKGFTLKAAAGDPDITLVTEDSRKVRPGSLFIAVKGTARDGHDFVREALDRGAAAVAVERPDVVPPGTAHVIFPESSADQTLAMLAARFHGNPAEGLSLVGFTGTFGKTTTSDILRALFEAAGRKPAVIGSLGVRFRDFQDPGDGLTTPAAPQLQEWLAALRRHGAETVVMEVTSHALRLRRVAGLRFDGGLLAPILPGEHTDFHRSYDDYVGAKRLFLGYLKPEGVLAYDADNRAARQLAAEAAVSTKAGFTFRRGGNGLLEIRDVALDDRGAEFLAGSDRIRSALLGRPNVRNAALALAYALASGVPVETARSVLGQMKALPRRMERLDLFGRTVLDDTSGHPESLAAVFEVAPLLPRERLVVAWAIRGNRGADVNRAMAFALADLTTLHGADELLVTASSDQTEPKDRARPEEVDAVRAALQLRGRRHAFHETLEDAMEAVAAASRAGDLVVLIGAQGMNEGSRLFRDALSVAR
ncbi:MAG TPA: Mur ligase family protein [Vicinamibacterales bacterium]|nr:Mur ligase family protein [Vicinamibacterales bacterium]